MEEPQQAIYEQLVRVAERGGTTYYSDIAPLAGVDMGCAVDRNRLFQILDGISRSEHSEGRPLLSAVVVRWAEKTPGIGFFTLARELGMHGGGDDAQYWAEELGRVHQQWRPI